MRLAHTLRLIVALLALGFAMAGSAAASIAMAPSMLPCHEQAHDDMTDAGDAPTHVTHAGSAGDHAMLDMGHPMAPDAARLHMCCVLTQFMAPLLAAPSLSHPVPRTSALFTPLAQRLAGVALATPVPPPRLL